jgi:hypothetical protein
MSQYTAKIVLIIDPFDAKNEVEASEILDEYISLIAHTGGDLTWNEVEWEVEEYNEQQTII